MISLEFTFDTALDPTGSLKVLSAAEVPLYQVLYRIPCRFSTSSASISNGLPICSVFCCEVEYALPIEVDALAALVGLRSHFPFCFMHWTSTNNAIGELMRCWVLDIRPTKYWLTLVSLS